MKKTLLLLLVLSITMFSLFAYDNIASFGAGYHMNQLTVDKKNGFAENGLSAQFSGANYLTPDSNFGVGYSFTADFPLSTSTISFDEEELLKSKTKDSQKAFDALFSLDALARYRFCFAKKFEAAGGIGIGAFYWATKIGSTDKKTFSSITRTDYLMLYGLVDANFSYQFSERFSFSVGADCGYIFYGTSHKKYTYKDDNSKYVDKLGIVEPYKGLFTRPYIKVNFCY